MNSLLMIGYGDVARRVRAQLPGGIACITRSRRDGFDLDRPASLTGLAQADALLHTAPPPAGGETDTRTAALLAALDEHGILPTRVVYISTSGVYGDCGGALVDETRAPDPRTPRARRRLDAERRLERWCAARGAALVILRAPGIYAADRLPLARLREGTPVLRDEDDVYTNHVHADDLAAACVRALDPLAPPGVYNASDDSRLRMGEWLDLVAERAGLARPPRIARSEAEGRIAPALLSFMSESRRLENHRLKEVLGVRLRYPTVHDGVPRHAGATRGA